MAFGNIEQILIRILGDSKDAEKALEQAYQKVTRFGVALTGMSAAASAAFYKLGKDGSALDVLERKFERVTKAFGQDAGTLLNTWQDAAKGAISRAELMAKANYLMLTGVPVAEMEWMLQAVSNASAATGRSMEDLFDKLSLGLARGSKLFLDDLGIILDVTAANETYAKSIGKSADALTDQEQKLAFVAAAREAAARQEQVLGKATESTATVIQRAETAVKDAGDELKKAFAPTAARVAKVVTFLAKAFQAIPQPVKRAAAGLASGAAGVGLIIGPILTVIGLLPKLKGMIGTVSAGLKMLGITSLSSLGPVLPIIAAVVAAILGLIAAAKLAARAWKSDFGGIRTAVLDIYHTIKPVLDQIANDVRYWIGQIKESFAWVMVEVRRLVEPAIIRLRQLLGYGFGLREFLTFARDFVNVILSTIKGLLDALHQLLMGNSDQAMAPLKDAALNIVTLIVLGWKKFVVKAARWGWNLIVSFAQGIVNAGRTVLRQAATFIGNMVSRFLASFSPPKEGPLTGIVKWGKNLIDSYLSGFALADFGVLRDTLSPIRNALETAVSLGDMDRPEMLETFRAVRTEVAGLIAEFRKTGQINEEVMAGIAQRLGEGAEEYTRYIRLTLEHQQAMQRLKSVQAEVADAEARGFIPDALRQKLEAAEGEVTAAEEAVNWQREYLASLQEGADIQREMVDALSEVAQKIGEAADGMAKLAGGLGGGEAEGPKLKLNFSGFSEAFEEEKAKVRAWFESLPGKVTTWLGNAKNAAIVKMQEWWEAAKETPVLGPIVEFLETKIPEGIETFRSVWEETFLPILERGRRFIDEDLKPLLDALRELIEVTLKKAVDLLAWTWKWVLLPALSDVWDFITTNVQPVFNKIVDFINEQFNAALEALGDWLGVKLLEKWDALMSALLEAKTNVLDVVLTVFENLSEWAKTLIDRIEILKEKIRNFHLPEDLKRRSPSPFELTFMGAAEHVHKLTKLLPGLERALDFQTGLGSLASAAMPAASMAGGIAGSGQTIIIQIGEQSFPNIRDGRDARGYIRELLDQATSAAGLRSTVPGSTY